jgi:NADH dehydrogenase/NADH:ubiquinone oxidoreductase subunit G
VPTVTINGIEVDVERGTSVLEAARYLGIPIPTLCHEDGLAPYGACRLCVVEIINGARRSLQTACTYRADDGLVVFTHSSRVEKARRLLLELYVATCPQSKRIQDMASAMGVRQCRYPAKHEACIQCGLCVRMCEQQMMAGAIGFAGRGLHRKVSRPFDITDSTCRQCGACLYICPTCELRCAGAQAESTLCSGCLNISTVCFQSYDNAMCSLDPCHACEIGGPFRSDVEVKLRAGNEFPVLAKNIVEKLP